MPYVIRPPRLRAAVAAVGASLLLGAVPAQATEITSASQCTEPVFSQPFLYAGDANWYTLAPGQSAGQFGGQGWTFSGGAKVVQGKLPNGSTGSVLDLPSGALATSPVFCVTNAYPTARTRVQNVIGKNSVNFLTSYVGAGSREAPKSGGKVTGSGSEWTLSVPVGIMPLKVEGWQLVRITLEAKGSGGDTHIDDLYVDPYVRR